LQLKTAALWASSSTSSFTERLLRGVGTCTVTAVQCHKPGHKATLQMETTAKYAQP